MLGSRNTRLRLLVVGEPNARVERLQTTRVSDGEPEFEITFGAVEGALSRLGIKALDAVIVLDGGGTSHAAEHMSKIRVESCEVPIIALSNATDDSLYVRLLEAGAHDVLPTEKLEPAELVRTIKLATARIAAERHYRSSEPTSRGTKAQVDAHVFDTDLDYYVTSWSESVQKRIGHWQWDLKPGFNLLDFLVRDDRRRILDHTIRVFNGEQLGAVEYVAQNRNGGRFSLFANLIPRFAQGRPSGLRIEVLEPTPWLLAEAERKRYQERLRQSQQLEALGLISAGVAHDLNNVLNAISLMAAGAARDVETDTPLAEDLRGIVRTCRSGGDLISRMLRFGKSDELKSERFSVNNQVAEVEFLLRFMKPKNVEVKLDLETNPTFVIGDCSQIIHCLFNVCINALHAMGDEGTLSVKTERLLTDKLENVAVDPPSSGAWVAIRIRDTGEGMDEETIDQVVNPFYSKDGARGTGLGMYMVDTAMKQHGGVVAIESTPGEGTTVTLLLPAAVNASEPMISAILRRSGRFPTK